MKIGILTQPLYTNYGGLLQCWALQHTLQMMGHETWVVQRMKKKHTFGKRLENMAKNIVRPLMGRPRMAWTTRTDDAAIQQYTRPFIEHQIVPHTKPIYSTQELQADYVRQRYDAYVVGSDQVWRPRYSPCQPDFFLDFLPAGSNVRRVAYAASFGTDEWEYPEPLTMQCRELAGRFDAISVRESGGIRLCEERLGVKATQVLDPTLLHEQRAYVRLVEETGEAQSPGNFFCYVLDRSEQKNALKQQVAEAMGLIPFEVMPQQAGQVPIGTPLSERVFPPVTRWLRAFMDAEYVLTDSFHGCVFSIIFNRPFVALGNAVRGQSRFLSLLEMFGLSNRLVVTNSANDIVDRLCAPIDWSLVNRTKLQWQINSIEYLNKALNANG